MKGEETMMFDYICPHCDKQFPRVYKNKDKERKGYWGDGQRYNHRGPLANFNRHVKSCNGSGRKVK